jgi:hypothetical protein
MTCTWQKQQRRQQPTQQRLDPQAVLLLQQRVLQQALQHPLRQCRLQQLLLLLLWQQLVRGLAGRLGPRGHQALPQQLQRQGQGLAPS